MPLPTLENWETTRNSLHAISKVLAALRKAYLPAQPLALHLALYTTPNGLTTGKTASGEFALNLATGSMEFTFADGSTLKRPLGDYLDTNAILREVSAKQDTSNVKAPENAPLHIDLSLAGEYRTALRAISTGIARYRTRLMGMVSPVVVWSHGFDVSTLWFKQPELDEHKPHINVGFSPGSAGFDRPYIYVYAYPMPDGFEKLPLPEDFRWYTASWRGAVLDYDTLANEADPEAALEAKLIEIYATLVEKL